MAPEVSGNAGIAQKCGRGALRAPVSRLNGCCAGAQESAPTESIRHPNRIQGSDDNPAIPIAYRARTVIPEAKGAGKSPPLIGYRNDT